VLQNYKNLEKKKSVSNALTNIGSVNRLLISHEQAPFVLLQIKGQCSFRKKKGGGEGDNPFSV
jgi:hypothetical protein